MTTGGSTESTVVETEHDIEEMVLSATNEALKEAGAPFDRDKDHTVTVTVEIELEEV